MADRVLPSRDEAAKEMALATSITEHDNRLSDMAWETFVAYMDGRLVDREAIDYEAAYRWASENFVPQKFVDQCLAAALPGEI